MADVKTLVRALTRSEKVTLTAGEDTTSVPAIEHLGVPQLRPVHGRNGARWGYLPGSGGPGSNEER